MVKHAWPLTKRKLNQNIGLYSTTAILLTWLYHVFLTYNINMVLLTFGSLWNNFHNNNKNANVSAKNPGPIQGDDD